MTHSDDAGLVLPPQVSPVQVGDLYDEDEDEEGGRRRLFIAPLIFIPTCRQAVIIPVGRGKKENDEKVGSLLISSSSLAQRQVDAFLEKVTAALKGKGIRYKVDDR
eukprot:764559-Hanusia_phi.AAC.1